MAESGNKQTSKDHDKRENNKIKDPPSIQYLFQPNTTYTCYFLVGSCESGNPELIGGCRLNLMAHSISFRRMLEESLLAEEGSKENPIKLPDVQPHTFRQLLRYIHGSKDVSYISMEDGIDLMYVAEKYFAEELKEDLAKHLASKLTVDNVFLPMERPECYLTETLKNAIEKVIQYDTEALLENEEFLSLSSFGLLNIVKQEGLAVTEIQLWRAVLKWAKHNATDEEIPNLRIVLSDHLKYIRFCTLTAEDFCREVMLTKILSNEEALSIARSFESKTLQEDLTDVCNEINPRSLLSSVRLFEPFKPNNSIQPYKSNTNYIITHDSDILLMKARLISKAFRSSSYFLPKGASLRYEGKITITRVTDYENDTSSELPLEISVSKDVEFNNVFDVELKVGGEYVKLLAHNKYKVLVEFNKEVRSYHYVKENEHLVDFDEKTKRIVIIVVTKGYLQQRDMCYHYGIAALWYKPVC